MTPFQLPAAEPRIVVGGVEYDNPAYYRESVDDAVMRPLRFPPEQWVIPGLVPAGLTLMVSPPKTGKSWLKLAMEQAVAYGGQFLGEPVGPPRRVLSLALEDNVRRLQRRAQLLTPDALVPSNAAPYSYHFSWPGASVDERIAWLHAYLLQAVEKDGMPFRLVTIDTLKKFSGANKRNAYDDENAFASRLNEIGNIFDLAIIAPHHTNKIRVSGEDEGDWLDRISGSAGLAGSSTTVMYLERSRGADTGVLHVTGWEGEDQELALRFEHGAWTRADDLEPDEARRSGAPAAVLRLLRTLGPMTFGELLAQSALPGESIKKACQRLQEAGQVGYDPVAKTWERAADSWSGMGQAAEASSPAAAPAPGPAPEALPLPADPPSDGELSDTEEENMTPDPAKIKSPGLAWLRESIANKDATQHPVALISRKHRESAQWQMAQKCLTGDHRWVQQNPDILARVIDLTEVYILDRNGSYLSACSNIPLAPNVLTHTGTDPFDKDRAGVYLIDKITWTFPETGHPLGRRAEKQEQHVVSAGQMETLIKLGLEPRIRDSYTGKRSTNLLSEFYEKGRDYRAQHHGTPEGDAFKRVAYGLRFLWTKQTGSPFWRPDWWCAVTGEANGRHWWKAYRACKNHENLELNMLAMQNTDTVTWAGGIPPEYEVDPVKLGAVKIKWQGTYAQWKQLDAGER